ncbi:MAG: BtrH N-terminal domain-containing protein [Desulfuromonadales bacterium]|nr:BtrH N-terminal domain-containing protein [Desulfuromonadales bacterium]
MNIDFPHRQSAHCESGVTANLLTHGGIKISEAMAFGIGSGLFFGYVPFLKMGGLPLITFRGAPGCIFRKAARRLGVEMAQEKFRRPERAREALDRLLAAGVPVGAQTGAYWLPYFPAALRFHFNGHNLVVCGREGGDYIISDPVFPGLVRCPAEDLDRARFSKGALAPKGRLYHLRRLPDQIDLGAAALAGIRDVCRIMLKTPVPFAGIRGMHLLARKLERWPAKLGDSQAALHLGHMIRMQEEIGTGGGGFRFIYAAFLQETAALLGRPELQLLSERMTAAGDRWRSFAVGGARICKGRPLPEDTYEALARRLRACAEEERQIYSDLQEVAR